MLPRLLTLVLALTIASPTAAVELVASSIEGVNVWTSKSDGTFSKGQSLSNIRFNSGGALGDLNGDGILDWFGVAFSSQPHQVWFGKGNGKFLPSKQKFGGEYASWSVVLADIDGDGDLDAFVSNPIAVGSCPPSEVWRNDGRGKFELAQKVGSGCSKSAAFGDLNGDGYPDIVTADLSIVDGHPAGPAPSKVWLNDGTGKFIDSGQRLGNSAGYAVAAADLNSDDNLDLFFANSGANTVWFNDGKGNFNDSGQRLENHAAYAVALGDLDNNGTIDAFVVTNDFNGNRVWLNDGKGNFRDSGQTFGEGVVALDVILVDINNDGYLDAMVAVRNLATEDQLGEVQIWLNDGTAHFTRSKNPFGSGHFRKVVINKK